MGSKVSPSLYSQQPSLAGSDQQWPREREKGKEKKRTKRKKKATVCEKMGIMTVLSTEPVINASMHFFWCCFRNALLLLLLPFPRWI